MAARPLAHSLEHDLRGILPRFDRPVPRYTSYPPVPAWTTGVGPDDYQAALGRLGTRPYRSAALYVHLPFCRTRCLYCGCNALATSRTEKADTYLDRLEHEFALVEQGLGHRHLIEDVHLGGGTPNRLTDDQLHRLGEMMERHFAIAPGASRAVEADPREVTPAQLAAFRHHGFDRISFGVQDVEPGVQQAIGRIQPAAVVQHAVDEARIAGFASVNLDIMYGLPRQTTQTFSRTIDAVLAMGPERIACFGYAHVPSMLKHQRAIREEELPGGPERLSLFAMAVERLEAAGYVWVGLDHFARPGDELARAFGERRLHRNFMGYTAGNAGDLIATGMSAISEVTGTFAQNDAGATGWAGAIDAGRLATVKGHRLSNDDLARRDAILELMCNLRLPSDLACGPLRPAYERIATYQREGLVEHAGDALHVTRLGRFFLRVLCAELDAYLPRDAERPRMSRVI